MIRAFVAIVQLADAPDRCDPARRRGGEYPRDSARQKNGEVLMRVQLRALSDERRLPQKITGRSCADKSREQDALTRRLVRFSRKAEFRFLTFLTECDILFLLKWKSLF